MVNQDNLVTKFVYRTSVNCLSPNRLFILNKDDGAKEFICIDGEKIIRLSYDIVFRDYTSVKPLYVVSLKKIKVENRYVYGIIFNKYFSEWDDPDNSMKYTSGMEIDLLEALNNPKYKPNYMVYRGIEFDKSPIYKDSETINVIYGYYNTDVNTILFFISKGLDWKIMCSMSKLRKHIYEYLKHAFGIQMITEKDLVVLRNYIEHPAPYKKIDLELFDIHNMPIIFDYIDAIELIEYDLTIDLDKFKNYYTAYNIVILKVYNRKSRPDNAYIMVFNTKSIINSNAEMPLSQDELSVLLDFNKVKG